MLHRPIPELSEIDLYRLWVYIQKKDGCWNWLSAGGVLAPFTKRPILRIKDHTYLVTRVLWKVITETDPGQMLVLHTCSKGQTWNKCVNPNHLYLGTHHDNRVDTYLDKYDCNIGSCNPNSRLREEDIITIRSQSESKTQIQLALKYNVTQSTISSILTRKSWTHI